MIRRDKFKLRSRAKKCVNCIEYSTDNGCKGCKWEHDFSEEILK